MKSHILLGIIAIINFQIVFSQNADCDFADQVVTSGAKRILSSYSLTSFLDTDFSTMHYCSNNFNEVNGGNFYLNYVDEGGSGMDAYPNVNAGGVKSVGTWYPGDKEKVGMPTTIESIPEAMNFEWKTSQENAWDEDDKWMASINFIFDNYGDETSIPDNALRNYDLVVMHESHNFNKDLNDLDEPSGTRIWYYARFEDGSLRPYELEIDEVIYKYAVRYKFFVGTETKDDKSHVKFIPYGTTGTPPVLKVNVKEIIQVSKDYIQYAAMPSEYSALANANIALNDAWLKAINAGYEVYEGTSVLKTDKFKVNLLSDVGLGDKFFNGQGASNNKTDLACHMYPNPTAGEVNIEMEQLYAEIEIVVRNVAGQVTHAESFNNTKHVRFELCDRAGVYFVEVKVSSGKKAVFKVVVS
ncbi:T9SS type A sorting domain-containing protein [Labilibacter sediminis]|nr:T9SS type A sorting domain-containing protein [Labilibacter sediminis]